MISECEVFAKSRGFNFSVNPIVEKSKTKCIIFSQKTIDDTKVSKITLNGMPLPWVKQLLHLGNTVESNNSFKKDIMIKRAKFIGKINTLSQEFHFASPDIKMNLFGKYCLSFYGSNLWDLFSKDVDKIYKSWNVTTRMCFSVPRNSHCYFIEPLSKCQHIKTMLCSRFSKFYNTMQNSKKPSVRILTNLCKNDTSTVYGNNLQKISKLCNTTSDELNPMVVKQIMCVYPCPVGEEWRIQMLIELCELKSNDLVVENFDNTEYDDFIEYLCTT